MPTHQSRLLLIILLALPFFTTAQSSIDHWETVVFNDDTWSYRVGTSQPPANWMQPDFDDSDWATGTGGFGYGDEDDNTIISPTLSVYIRIKFDLADTVKIRRALLHADYDDAFVAYWNGVEFARGNFGAAGTSPAFNDIPPIDHEADLYVGGVPEAFTVDAQTFNQLAKEGENVLAIQIHNFLLSSSDLSSNFFLSLGIADNSLDYEPTPDWFYEPFVFTSSNLPLLRINTAFQTIVDEPKIVANLQIVDNGVGEMNFIDDPATDYDGQIAIEIRGASSQFFDKKNYGFETQLPDGENNNVSLLGMPAENDWILHGPYSDKSL
ncbi:MAG: CotH kinase family protein, partial [Saprospiraceae bacterium]